MRVGFGYDVHALGDEGKLILGGVVVSEKVGVKAHSDGDVLCHAIIDAVVGVEGKDIGEIFPETEENENMRSVDALKKVVETVGRRYRIVSVDCTVVLSNIKLSPFREEIVENIKRVTRCGDVSVKFKSGNGVGEVGTGKAIEAFAVVLLEEIG